MDRQLFQIHRGKFELDPGGNRGQPSIWRITHGVFFLRVGKDALNGLRTQRVACLAKRRMPHVLRALYVVVPDMARHGLCALLIFSAAFTDRTVPANVALAFVLPVAFAADGGITQNLVLWAEDAVVVFIVDICISGQVAFLCHWPFVGRRRDSPAVEDLLADPRRFVARVGGDRLRLGTALDQALKHPVKDHAVMDIAGRDLCFQHIAPPVADGVRLVGEAFPALALLKYAAVRVGRRFRHRFLLCRGGRRTVIVVVIFLFQGSLSMHRLMMTSAVKRWQNA